MSQLRVTSLRGRHWWAQRHGVDLEGRGREATSGHRTQRCREDHADPIDPRLDSLHQQAPHETDGAIGYVPSGTVRVGLPDQRARRRVARPSLCGAEGTPERCAPPPRAVKRASPRSAWTPVCLIGELSGEQHNASRKIAQASRSAVLLLDRPSPARHAQEMLVDLFHALADEPSLMTTHDLIGAQAAATGSTCATSAPPGGASRPTPTRESAPSTRPGSPILNALGARISTVIHAADMASSCGRFLSPTSTSSATDESRARVPPRAPTLIAVVGARDSGSVGVRVVLRGMAFVRRWMGCSRLPRAGDRLRVRRIPGAGRRAR